MKKKKKSHGFKPVRKKQREVGTGVQEMESYGSIEEECLSILFSYYIDLEVTDLVFKYVLVKMLVFLH